MPALTLCSVCLRCGWDRGLGWGNGPKPSPSEDVVSRGLGWRQIRDHPLPKGLSAAAFCNREGA